MVDPSQAITYEVRDSIATITLNKPDRLNTLNPPITEHFATLLDDADADDSVRAIIITGAGRSFCAGADLSTNGVSTFDYERFVLGSGAPVDGVPRDWGGLLTLRIFRSLKPVIGAVNGAAVGLGATMLLPMDLRVGSTASKFGFVFARRGIVPEAASSWFLPRIVGISTAIDWACSGRIVSGDEAFQRGLLRSLHAPEDLLSAARRIARELTENSAPVSVALTRQMMWRMLGANHPMDAHRVDSRAIYARGRSSDTKEGIASFLEKRPAKFTDKVSTELPDIFGSLGEPPYS